MITVTITWQDIVLYFVLVFVASYLKAFIKSAWKEFRNRKH